MSDFQIIPLQNSQPSPNSAVNRRLIGKVSEWRMISLNNDGVWALEIMFSFANVPHDTEQLPSLSYAE